LALGYLLYEVKAAVVSPKIILFPSFVSVHCYGEISNDGACVESSGIMYPSALTWSMIV